MTETPTRSLRASANPQARMQELLKQPTDATHLQVGAIALPDSSTTSSAVAQNCGSTDIDAGSSIEISADSSTPALPRRKLGSPRPVSTTAQKRKSVPAQKSTDSDPVRQAMLGMLALPYPDDMGEGVMTVTSVKIPRPIWERLEYARTLTKMDKQDIIADALRIYFELIVEGEAGR